jgi:hypothetical protein
MIRRSAIIASAVAVLAVAGCNNKDGDSSPTPTPTPTPTPSASATPTYSVFPLTAAAELFSVSASTSYSGDPAAGPVTLGTAGTDGFSNRVRFALQNVAPATDTLQVVVRENTEESRFGTGDLLTAPAPAVTEYVYRESTAPTTAGAFTQLDLLNNTISGQVTSDTALALTRVTYGGWWRGDSTTGAKRITYATMGYPTVATDMPTSGTVTYTVRVAGRSVVSPAAGASSVDKLTGTATLTINYATGLVNLSMTLNRGAVAYGTFTGTGAITAGNNQFTGSFGTGSAAGGTFQGLAYGPQAAEIGISFAITGTVAAGDTRAVGVVVGRKS